jgi:hypothetical protein
MIPAALATGNCTLLTEVHVLRVNMHGIAHRAAGVTYTDATGARTCGQRRDGSCVGWGCRIGAFALELCQRRSSQWSW